jgi:hypothetical protein
MAKQKIRPTRLGGFSGSKAYIQYVEILKKRRNAVGRTFCDATQVFLITGEIQPECDFSPSNRKTAPRP